MATVAIPTGDSAQIHYDLERALPVSNVFLVEVSYRDTPIPATAADTSVAIGAGAYSPLVNGRFTMPAGETRFSIMARINRDPNTVQDNTVVIKVTPAPGAKYIANTTSLDVSVEIIDGDGFVGSIMSADAVAGSVTEGQVAQTTYTLFPPVTQPVTVTLGLTYASGGSAADVGTIRYRLDDAANEVIPVGGNINLPIGTEFIHVLFTALEDATIDPNEQVLVSAQTATIPGVITNTLPVIKTWTVVNTTVPPAGTLLNDYCVGTTLWGTYADGAGGSNDAIIEEKSPDCGWAPPPAGTILDVFCVGDDKMAFVADGNDGYTTVLQETNSYDCGYVPDIPNDQDVLTPTQWNPLVKGATVELSEGNRRFSGKLRDATRSEYGALFGKWYWEHEVYIPREELQPGAYGIVRSTHNILGWIGSTDVSWAWWPYDGTSYNDDEQSFYGGEVEDLTVISVLLDMVNHTVEMWLDGVSQGIMYSNLPDEKIYAAVSALGESYVVTNFGNKAFRYPVPAGFYPGFGVLHEPPLERGTEIGTFCDGFDNYTTYANGKFGTYNVLTKVNDPLCGWTPPPPPAGTFLRYICKGMDRWTVTADGSGGEIETLQSVNSTACGYVPPPTPAFAPTVLNPAFFTGNTVISGNGREAILDGGLVRTNASVYSGRWRWEATATTSDLVLGIGTSSELVGNYVGETAASYGWSLGTQQIFHNGVAQAYGSPVQPGDVIGTLIDFVAGTLSFTLNGVDQGVAYTGLVSTYFAMASDWNPTEETIVTFNFGQVAPVDAPPTGFFGGLGVAQTIWAKRGTAYSYFCVGTTRKNTYHDGGGGYYTGDEVINSPSCGWVAPKPAGTLISKQCVGVAHWATYADGNYGTYDELLEARSILCGYRPYGTLISAACVGYDRIGTYSDGEFGTYQQVIATNSYECGYGAGEGGSGPPPGTIDPNLPPTNTNGEGDVLFRTTQPTDGDILFDIESPPA